MSVPNVKLSKQCRCQQWVAIVMEAVAMLKLRAAGSTRSGCKLQQCKNELTQAADGVDEGVGGKRGSCCARQKIYIRLFTVWNRF